MKFYDFSSAYELESDEEEEWEDLEGEDLEDEMVEEECQVDGDADNDGDLEEIEAINPSSGPSLANAGKYRRPAPAER
jgi:hypothetical protein